MRAEAQSHASILQAEPGVDIGRELACYSNDVVALTPIQPGGYQAQPGGGVLDEGDCLGARPDQLRDPCPHLDPQPLPMVEVEGLL